MNRGSDLLFYFNPFRQNLCETKKELPKVSEALFSVKIAIK